MRNTWYADPRDVVKWGSLVHLAQREKLATIVQVAMYVKEPAMGLQTSSGRVNLPDPVWEHFRDLRAIKRLEKGVGVRIIVHDAPFDLGARREYFDRAAERLRRISGKKAVLLDPDTGLARSRPSRRHVSEDEVRLVWESLRRGDWLLLYQHAWRKQGWEEEARVRFAVACELEAVETYRADESPSNVVVLTARKP